MSTWGLWATILAVAGLTYLLRLSFIEMWQWLRIPPVLQQALHYVPSAVLAALVLPAFVRSAGAIDLSPENFRLVAGVVAALVAWFSRSVLLTLAVGMATLWLLQWFA